MNFISICSGIEAASVAFGPLGWKAIAFSEIEPFPCAVLAHHYPDVPNFGDMTKFREWPEEIFADADAVVGGPPCQAFSVAGARNGLNDDRGNLTLTYAELINHADAIRFIHGKPPVVVLYENVPGLLSDKTGAFGCFLAGLSGEDDPLVAPGGRWTNAGCVSGPQRTVAWRVLDAQYFGVAQRRRRVFVVASARKGFDPAQVLFEWDGVRRDTAPSRQTGEVAPTIPARSTAGGGLGTDFDCDGGTICVATGQAGAEIGADMAPTLNCNHEAPYVAHSLRGEGFDAIEDGTGRGTPLGPVAFAENSRHELRLEGGDGQRTGALSTGGGKPGQGVPMIAFPANLSGTQCASAADVAPSMGAANPTAVAFNFHKSGNEASSLGVSVERVDCLRAFEKSPMAVQPAAGMQVRRLTPEECEALQGFPRAYTAIPWRGKPAALCPDGPRYKALGNSWAVPNVRWIGERIQRHLAGDL